MDKEKARLERIWTTVVTPGWEDLIEEFTAAAEATDSIRSVTDAEKLHFMRGRLATLNEFINIKENTREALDAPV